MGPAEWDWAALPEIDDDLDVELASLCRDLRAVSIPAFCWAQYGRAPELDRAAEYFLERLHETF